MQTTGSLRPSYQYHQDYGTLNECHSLSRQQQQHLSHDTEASSVGGLLLLHHHEQQQPHFIQLSSLGTFEPEQQQHHASTYEEQQVLEPSVSQQQQPMLVYNLDQPESENYSQQPQTTTAHEDQTHYTSANFPIDYQQQQQLSTNGAIYYEATPTISYSNEERPPMEGNIASSRQDQPVYCESLQPNSADLTGEPISTANCNLEPPHQAYFHHYTTAEGQQNSIDPNHRLQTDDSIYRGDCAPPELTHQTYPNLDTIAGSKQQTAVAGILNNTNQLLELSAPEMGQPPIAEGEKSSYGYTCYGNQLHHFDFGNNNSNDNQHCLMGSVYSGPRHESHSSAASTISDSSSEESSISTLTRDEKRAREANLPMSYHEIVNLSIDQFNEQLARHSLTELQLQLIKDIRRRGKNKVAAQSCRKRKMEQIYELQHEVGNLANKRMSLEHECDQLIREYEKLAQDYNKINAIVQRRLQQTPLAACGDQNHLPSTC